MLSVLLFWRWWAERKLRREARLQAVRHMAVIAHALYTGSTASYSLTPDLPRRPDSTCVGWSSRAE